MTINPDETQDERFQRLSLLAHPRPLNSLVASAQRITKATVKNRRGFGKPEEWQDDAWDMYDLVGEQRFLATTLAGRLAQAKFYVGKVSDDPIEPAEPLDTDESLPSRVFNYFGNSPASRAQMIARLGVNLFVAGDGWLVGIPRKLLPKSLGGVDEAEGQDKETNLDDLEWRMLSVSEVSSNSGERVLLTLGESREEQISADPDDIWLIRVWRPHPRKWWQADSPTRSSLGVLRELVSLTMHISAQVDSRLAGAGILVVPASAKRAIAMSAGIDPDLEDDPFTEALVEAMMTAIRDRSSAAALVPLVITVPDDATGLFQHITFSTPLDGEARELRDEAIRRLALGQDAPPELLLGMSTMNHWGAWLVQEDVVTTHLEPPLALICDAITTQFLHPVLIDQGMPEEEARQYVVWYDVGHMIQRPNRLADATNLFDKGVVSDETLRDAGGFSDTDAPSKLSRSVELAIQMATTNPALVDNLKEIIAAFDEVLNPASTQLPAVPTTDVIAPDQGPPQAQAPAPVEPAAVAASAFQNQSHNTSVAIMALPAESANLPMAADDTGEQPEVPHATVLYFGHIGEHMPVDTMAKSLLIADLAQVASEFEPFTAKVKGLDTLGDEGALVWLLDSPDLNRIFTGLLDNASTEELYDLATENGVNRYPDYTPHVTVGYNVPMSGDGMDTLSSVTEIPFDRLALWWGDERFEFICGPKKREQFRAWNTHVTHEVVD